MVSFSILISSIFRRIASSSFFKCKDVFIKVSIMTFLTVLREFPFKNTLYKSISVIITLDHLEICLFIIVIFITEVDVNARVHIFGVIKDIGAFRHKGNIISFVGDSGQIDSSITIHQIVKGKVSWSGASERENINVRDR
jgi:hypothetical protein